MRKLLILCICTLMVGCADISTRHQRWEISFAVGVTEKINEQVSITQGVTLKTMTGQAQKGAAKVELSSNEKGD